MFLKRKRNLVLLPALIFCALGILVFIAIGTVSANAAELFSSYQAIPTIGASDWESFEIDGEAYLAVANSVDNNRNVHVNSTIYKWNSVLELFEEFQTIPTTFAHDWESFTINGETYLIVGYHRNNSYQYNLNSRIYKWNGSSFEEFQAIPASNAQDWESFTIGTDTYLAVANGYNGSTYNIDSKIYKWNVVLEFFEEIQAIPTSGAQDWKSFTIEGETYLAVANYYNGYSKIYKWNGSLFEEFQNIATVSAYEWEGFTINGEIYLVVANVCGVCDSTVYKWNDTSFVEIQFFPTLDAHDWKAFAINDETYLAVANSNNNIGYAVDSIIYRWSGTLFEEFQAIPTYGASGWESFTINGDIYLAVANSINGSTREINSIVYKANKLVAPGDGLIAHWTFDNGSLSDLSEHNNTLSNNGALSVPGINGVNDTAYEIEGYDSMYISDADQSGLDIAGDFTYLGWLKINSPFLDSSWGIPLVFKWLPPLNKSYIIRASEVSAGAFGEDETLYDRLTLIISPDGLGEASGNRDDYYSDPMPNFTPGVWYHVGVSWDASESKAVFYRDGSLISEEYGSATSIYNGSADFQIGGTNEYNDKASFDEVRVYNRVLSLAEIQALYEIPAYCGDANVDAGEECDDGNTDNNDGCDENCLLETAPDNDFSFVHMTDVHIGGEFCSDAEMERVLFLSAFYRRLIRSWQP